MQARAFWVGRHMKSLQQSSADWLQPNRLSAMHCEGRGRHVIQGQPPAGQGPSAHMEQAGPVHFDTAQASAACMLHTARCPSTRTCSSEQLLTGWQKPNGSVGFARWHLLLPQQSAEVAQP